MDKTAITASPPPPAAAESIPVALRAPKKPLTLGRAVHNVLSALASLRLTVWLFAFSIALVFFGTLAQVDHGILVILTKYFRTLFAWVPLQIFFPRDWHVGGGFPFPGGQLLGGLLLINVFAAHAVRFKLTWKRSGIFLIHAGIIVIMLSEIVTTAFAVESRMQILKDQTVDYVVDLHQSEFVVLKPGADKKDDVVAVPGSWLEKQKVIQNELLPFDIEVVRYFHNSNLTKRKEGQGENLADAGLGLKWRAVEETQAVGVDSSGQVDVPAAYLALKKKDTGEPLGTYLVWSYWCSAPGMEPKYQQVEVDGQTYDIGLRFKRTYKTDYAVKLLQFRHDKFVGSNTPKNYSSKVLLVHPNDPKQDREVLIFMNAPLHYAGETFYQADIIGNDEGTILQVVKNPGWTMPYLAFVMVSVGLLVHFTLHLVSFIERRPVP